MQEGSSLESVGILWKSGNDELRNELAQRDEVIGIGMKTVSATPGFVLQSTKVMSELARSHTTQNMT